VELDPAAKLPVTKGEATANLELSDDTRAKLITGFGEENGGRLLHLLEAVQLGDAEAVADLPVQSDKQARTLFHKNVRDLMPGYCSSLVKGTEDTIRVFLKEGVNTHAKRRKLGMDVRSQDPLPGKFIEFVMWKRNFESMAAIKRLAKAVGTKPKHFGIAGNKDKRGITTQKVTLYANNYPRLKTLNLGRDLKLGNFRYTDDELSIGALTGNRFEMTLRDAPSDVPLEEFLRRID
jgi:tRNA pseudouridine13 synthase